MAPDALPVAPNPPTDPLLQAKSFGPYRLERKAGAGSIGAVYLGLHLVLNLRHAVKVLHPSLRSDPAHLSRFLREARLTGKLRHPYIIPIVAADRAGDIYYLAMPFIEGETLSDRIARGGPLPPAAAVRYTWMIARALEYAHSLGVVHRDIKASNVLVDRTDTARLMDFGLVCMMPQPGGKSASQTTDAAAVVGTPQYMPPEQWQGGAVDARSDLFSLGVTLYHLLTREYPFPGRTVTEIGACIQTGSPVPLRERRSDVEPRLADLAERAIQRDPGRRFQTARDFALALESWLKSQGAPAPGAVVKAAGASASGAAGRPDPAAQEPLGFARLTDRMDRIPALPLVFHEVRKLASDRTTDAQTLVDVIEKDPALTARVLKLANSAITSFRTRVGGLKLAVSLLGNSHILGLTSSVLVLQNFRRPAGAKFDPARFWNHGMLTGCCALQLNKHFQLGIRDDLFTYGMIHDIGKIVIYENLPAEFDRIISLYEGGVPFRQAEVRVLGVDHTVVGALLGEQWKLPNDMVECIRSHHELPETVRTPLEQLRMLVFLANVLAHLEEARQTSGKYPALRPDFLARVRLTQAEAEQLAAAAFVVSDAMREHVMQ